MRELSEYKNAIFERSKKKIEKRKRLRKMTVVFCVPLLCMGIFLFVLSSNPEKSGDVAYHENNLKNESQVESYYDYIVSASLILQSGEARVITQGNAEKLYDEIYLLVSLLDEGVQDSADDECVSENNSVSQEAVGSRLEDSDKSEQETDRQTIVFSFNSGSSVEFVLDNGKLITRENETIDLPEEVYLKILGFFAE